MIRPRLSLLACLALVLASPHALRAGAPDADAAAAPRQQDVALPPIRRDRFTLTPVARFEATARVLARRDYRGDVEAALAPTDLALGWGRMSDPRVTASLRFSQAARWYHWRYARAPIPPREIEHSSANMHFIPATDAVAQALARVRVGDLVAFRGSLVDARRVDGWTWRTSRRRDDTGAGACEIVYVEDLRVY